MKEGQDSEILKIKNEKSVDNFRIRWHTNHRKDLITQNPFLILGGSQLGAKLNDIRRRNALSELNQFTVYIITAFVGTTGSYAAEKHKDCTIAYNSIGGDSNVNFPISVYYSNNITTGTVNKLADDFTFTADVTV